jgi:hypothetical protein
LLLVVTPDPSGAIGAACEAGMAANASAATAKAKTVLFIEALLGSEAVFKVHATRQQQRGRTSNSYHEWDYESACSTEI